MGEPIKIMDLARDLIELSGYQVGRDIDITIMVACTNSYHHWTSAGGEIAE